MHDLETIVRINEAHSKGIEPFWRTRKDAHYSEYKNKVYAEQFGPPISKVVREFIQNKDNENASPPVRIPPTDDSVYWVYSVIWQGIVDNQVQVSACTTVRIVPGSVIDWHNTESVNKDFADLACRVGGYDICDFDAVDVLVIARDVIDVVFKTIG